MDNYGHDGRIVRCWDQLRRCDFIGMLGMNESGGEKGREEGEGSRGGERGRGRREKKGY